MVLQLQANVVLDINHLVIEDDIAGDNFQALLIKGMNFVAAVSSLAHLHMNGGLVAVPTGLPCSPTSPAGTATIACDLSAG